MVKEVAVDPVFQRAPTTHEDLAGLLADVTHEFASSLDVEETLQNAIDQIIVYLNAEAASIFLLENDDAELVCRKCAGPVNVTGIKLKPDQGIVGQTVIENAPQIVRDVSENPSFAGVVDADTGFVTRSILCAPLTVRGQCIGALELINKRSGDRLFATSDMHLATAVASAAALAIHNARMAEALVEQERVRKELELARQIQVSLLPASPDADSPIHGLNIPAREVSGDFYDFSKVSGGRIYFSLADVSGKGMNAALLMAKTTSLLRCLAKGAERPSELLRLVNEEICETASMGMFVTIVAGYIYPETQVVEFSNAGHQPPVFRDARGAYRELPATAPPIGILSDIEFQDTRLKLDGGSLFIFTDGVSECVNAAGEPLDVDGLCTVIDATMQHPPAERLTRIVAALDEQNRQFHDDMTLVLIEMGNE